MKNEVKRVLVTGGAGRAGRVLVNHLLESGYDVTSVDILPWPQSPCPHIVADLLELGECAEVCRAQDGIVHLAGIFAVGVRTAEVTFRVNTLSTFNVFTAASMVGVRRVVWASSTAVMGAPFGQGAVPPRLPLIEVDTLETSTTYALSKAVGELIATQRRLWPGLGFLALRFAWIFHPDEYSRIPGYWPDPRSRIFNLWAYLDVRDAAQACRRALEAPIDGAEAFFITSTDTVMNRPTRQLVAEYLPTTRLEDGVPEFGTLFSIEKAHRLLGYQPAHSWRQHV